MPISDSRNTSIHVILDQIDRDEFHLAGERAVIATMHGKERVICPVLTQALGLNCLVPSEFDTDRFGTFTREIERTGSQLDAARAKIKAAFATSPDIRVALASEGSFGPHPGIPFASLGRELVLLVDRQTGLEIVGHDATMDTNFAHVVVDGPAAASAFAERMRFPEYGLIVMGCRGDQPAPDIVLRKGIVAPDELEHLDHGVEARDPLLGRLVDLLELSILGGKFSVRRVRPHGSFGRSGQHRPQGVDVVGMLRSGGRHDPDHSIFRPGFPQLSDA